MCCNAMRGVCVCVGFGQVGALWALGLQISTGLVRPEEHSDLRHSERERENLQLSRLGGCAEACRVYVRVAQSGGDLIS